MYKKLSSSRVMCVLIAVVAVVLIAAVRIVSPQYTDNAEYNVIIDTLISRCIAIPVFIFLLHFLKFNVFSMRIKYVWLTVPCIAVAINNMPVISLISGDAYIDGPALWILVFALQCIAVAVYEELAFRGVLLMLILGHRKGKKTAFSAVILSSAVFGLFHLLNLFDGADIGSTVMQIGYSFLVGGMCGALMLICGSIYPSIIVHAVYNFCGYVTPTFGGGTWWDAPTVIITVVLAVSTAATIIITLYKKADEIAINE